MENRVYAIVGIKSILSNWNADFTGNPKTTSTAQIFGSDKAFKYPIKKMWENEGKKVMYIKSYKIADKEGLQPIDLSERYEKLFSQPIEKATPVKEVLRNLFTCEDILNFGATFAAKKSNVSITGAVQVGQGFNKYEDTHVEVQTILSPFRNSKDKEANASSLGEKIMVDEAHYVYPISINPENYNDYKELLEGFEGYTEEAYLNFKKACLVGATYLNTNSKAGCENEFAIFIEAKKDSKLYLANLDSYVEFQKTEGEKDCIDIHKLIELLQKEKDKIEKVQIYYNQLTLEIDTKDLECEVYDLYDEVK